MLKKYSLCGIISLLNILSTNLIVWKEATILKVMSFNTQHCLNYRTQTIDFQVMADAILQCDVDIIGLNEMRDLGIDPTEYDKQTTYLSELTGIPHYYFAKAIDTPLGPYGNAFLSKLPIISAETIPVPDPIPDPVLTANPDPKTGLGYYESRCLLKAKLEGGWTVLVIHFGLNPGEQENAVKTILEHLEDTKCILMGDFNLTPDNAILHPIRDRMIDTAALFAEPLLSFPSDHPTRKIDYVFVSPDVEILSADIPAIVASDHRPHLAEIQ